MRRRVRRRMGEVVEGVVGESWDCCCCWESSRRNILTDFWVTEYAVDGKMICWCGVVQVEMCKSSTNTGPDRNKKPFGLN